MSFQFEVGSGVGSSATIDESEFIGNFNNLYNDQDFGSLGVDPFDPTEAKPGSSDKVMMLAARYAAGLPLWNDSDCYDHGPDGQMEEMEV